MDGRWPIGLIVLVLIWIVPIFLLIVGFKIVRNPGWHGLLKSLESRASFMFPNRDATSVQQCIARFVGGMLLSAGLLAATGSVAMSVIFARWMFAAEP